MAANNYLEWKTRYIDKGFEKGVKINNYHDFFIYEIPRQKISQINSAQGEHNLQNGGLYFFVNYKHKEVRLGMTSSFCEWFEVSHFGNNFETLLIFGSDQGLGREDVINLENYFFSYFTSKTHLTFRLINLEANDRKKEKRSAKSNVVKSAITFLIAFFEANHIIEQKKEVGKEIIEAEQAQKLAENLYDTSGCRNFKGSSEQVFKIGKALLKVQDGLFTLLSGSILPDYEKLRDKNGIKVIERFPLLWRENVDYIESLIKNGKASELPSGEIEINTNLVDNTSPHRWTELATGSYNNGWKTFKNELSQSLYDVFKVKANPWEEYGKHDSLIKETALYYDLTNLVFSYKKVKISRVRGGFIILPGSSFPDYLSCDIYGEAMAQVNPKIYKKNLARLEEYSAKGKGFIDENGEFIITSSLFEKSPNTCAELASCAEVDGWENFKLSSGTSLNEVYDHEKIEEEINNYFLEESL